MNRRGATVTEWTFFGVWDMIEFSVFLIFIWIIATSFAPKAPDLLEQHAVLLEQRLLHTEDGIAYVDPITHRVYPYIIDLNKLKTTPEDRARKVAALAEHLYFADDQYLAINISLHDPTTLDRYSLVLNERWYQRWKPLADKPVYGGAKRSLVNDAFMVLLRRGDALIPAQLTIEVVRAP